MISTGQGSLSSRAGKSTAYWAEYTRVNLRRWLCCTVEIALALEPSRPSVLLDFRKITSTLYASVSCSVKWLCRLHKIFYIMCLAHNRCSKHVNLPSLLYFIPGWKTVSRSHSACLEKLVLASLGGQWSNLSGHGFDSSHSCTPNVYVICSYDVSSYLSVCNVQLHLFVPSLSVISYQHIRCNCDLGKLLCSHLLVKGVV